MTSLLCAFSISMTAAQQPMAMQQRFQDLAGRVQLFQPGDIIYDRTNFMSYLPKGWAEDWEECRREITSGKHRVADLVGLLGHPDPKVRTLAMAALFHREDPQFLPHFAKLRKDKGKTFPSYFGRSRILGDKAPATPQEFTEHTVGDIAAMFIESWTQPASYADAGDFDKYWADCKQGKLHCASWYFVRVERATTGSRPFKKELTEKVKKVGREIDQLPGLARDWTLVWMAGQLDYEGSREVMRVLASEDEVLAAARRIGPTLLLRLVQGKAVNDDPDFGTDEKGLCRRFGSVHYVLKRARFLLRPVDAEAVLAAEKVLPARVPWCIMAAAEMRPDMAEVWLRDGFRRFNAPDGLAHVDLNATVQRIRARGYNLPDPRISPGKQK